MLLHLFGCHVWINKKVLIFVSCVKMCMSNVWVICCETLPLTQCASLLPLAGLGVEALAGLGVEALAGLGVEALAGLGVEALAGR